MLTQWSYGESDAGSKALSWYLERENSKQAGDVEICKVVCLNACRRTGLLRRNRLTAETISMLNIYKNPQIWELQGADQHGILGLSW
jgi:hypothetical protein